MNIHQRIFFDLDGPILDVSERHYRIYQETVCELGGTPIDKTAFWESKRQKISEKQILLQSGLAEPMSMKFAFIKLERIESEADLQSDVLQVGILDALHRLRSSRDLFLVTLRSSRQRLEQQLARLGLTSFFMQILCGRDVDRDGWSVKFDLIRGSCSEAGVGDWIVGDTETDIRAGQSLGLRTAAVANGIRSEAFLRTLRPDCIISSAADFPQYLADNDNSVC